MKQVIATNTAAHVEDMSLNQIVRLHEDVRQHKSTMRPLNTSRITVAKVISISRDGRGRRCTKNIQN